MNHVSHQAFIGMRVDDGMMFGGATAPPVEIALRSGVAVAGDAPVVTGGDEPLLVTLRRDRVFVPVLVLSAAIHIAVAAAFGLYDRPRIGMAGGQEIPVEIVVETIDNSPGADDVRLDLPMPDLPPDPVFPPPEPVQVAEAPAPVELPEPDLPPPLVLPEPEPLVQAAEALPPLELPPPDPPPPLAVAEPEPPPPEPDPPVQVAEAQPLVDLPPPEPLALAEPEPPPRRLAEVQLPDVEVPPPEPPPPLFLPKPEEPPAPVQMVEAGPVQPPPVASPAPLPPPDLARREQERRKAAEEARRKQEQVRQEQARRDAQARREAQQKAAAAAPRPAAASAGDIASFKARVAGKLASSKRYPDAARSRGATGVAVVSFRIDASGNPSGVSLAKSSGHADLDAETLAMVRRAAPFPAPPQGAPTSFSVPINYNLR